LKVTPEVKRRLDAAARAEGRTQSQVAEMLLERAFREEELFGGAAARQLTHLMSAAFVVAGRRSGLSEWTRDVAAYVDGVAAVLDTLLTGLPASNADRKLAIEALTSRLLTYLAQERLARQDKEPVA
jgi:hypothetical protein